ncbi:hypothetical protein GCM10010441_31650 [Kitasatospora paracochleata]|uniref:Uncharacterized protein n=1 Tax=Kitasatospora paracochleata TaxID=58354 RepID=A0ABT1IQ16_9ACTN|nr:hypothetical protein [Kitasatospora paracochleata]MCP2307221.1 hypothetical protein [Kitasatospora paracochleata]
MTTYLTPPLPPTAVPPRRGVPLFPPIRGGGGWHRLRQAVRRRPGVLATGLLAAATALTAGPLHPGAPPPVAPVAPPSPHGGCTAPSTGPAGIHP